MADVIYYAVEYRGRITVVRKFGRHFGLTEERIRKIEALLNSHPTKTLTALKLAPILPTPGLMIAGTSRMPLKKFITICAFAILPKTIFLRIFCSVHLPVIFHGYNAVVGLKRAYKG